MDAHPDDHNLDDILIEAAITGLQASMPAVFARREIPKYVGGPLTVGTLANLGKDGPPYFLVNKHATYEKSPFLKMVSLTDQEGKMITDRPFANG